MPNIDDVGSLSVRDDIIIANVVPLEHGSAYQPDPLACHGRADKSGDRRRD